MPAPVHSAYFKSVYGVTGRERSENEMTELCELATSPTGKGMTSINQTGTNYSPKTHQQNGLM